MLQAFKFGLDKFASLGLPNFQNEEIYLILNQAQERFIKQRYGTTNVKKFGFESIQKRTEDLKNVVKNANLTPSATSSDNISNLAQFVTLPDDYWISVFERAKIQYLNCTGQLTTDTCWIKEDTHENYNFIIDNPYERPNKDKVVKLMAQGKAELIHSSDVTLLEYNLRYIRKPLDISDTQDCELSEFIHQEIVNLGITIGLEGIESEKRLQTFIPVIQNTQE